MLKIAPIVREFLVKPKPAKAFEIFAHRMAEWVPGEHSLLAGADRKVVIDPVPGGTWYEVDAAGNWCNWGKVAAYSPPDHLALIWQLNHAFEYDPKLETQIDVTFRAHSSGTQIRFEHSGLDAYGEHATQMRERLEAPGAWTHWFDGLKGLIG